MTDDDHYLLIGQLQRHEDAEAFVSQRRRFMPYRDTVGKLTIGWGRNLDDVGINAEEADGMLVNDMRSAMNDLLRTFRWFMALDSVRQAALVNIRFNLGLTRLLTFQKALRAMAAGNYALAADEFFDSKWARQVGQRAVELCAQIRTGHWQS